MISAKNGLEYVACLKKLIYHNLIHATVDCDDVVNIARVHPFIHTMCDFCWHTG